MMKKLQLPPHLHRICPYAYTICLPSTSFLLECSAEFRVEGLWALLLCDTVNRSEIVPRWRTYFVCELFSIEDVLEPNKSSLMNAFASWAWDSELLMCHLGDTVLLRCRDELERYHGFPSTFSTLYFSPPQMMLPSTCRQTKRTLIY